jgi:hypothetical protein
MSKRTKGAFVFSVEMLPANEGDALWIEYGADPVRRILVDCGRRTAYRAVADRLGADADLGFELFVLTHVDADHVAGAVPLFGDARFNPTRVGDVWFNGWRHLNGRHKDFDDQLPGLLSARQGEFFAALLREREFRWNKEFGGFPVVIDDNGRLPQIELDGKMFLTLLGPTRDKLAEMRDRWEEDLLSDDPEKRLDPGDYERALDLLGRDSRHRPDVLSGGHEGPIDVDELIQKEFDPDTSEPNGSSISFLAEHDGVSVMFAADAHAPQLVESIGRLLEERGLPKLKLDALKMSHHGSERNNSFELLELIDCRRYLISTNGAGHHHPDPATLARVIDVNGRDVEFFFNYDSDETALWADEDLIRRLGHIPHYPTARQGGCKVSL